MFYAYRQDGMISCCLTFSVCPTKTIFVTNTIWALIQYKDVILPV